MEECLIFCFGPSFCSSGIDSNRSYRPTGGYGVDKFQIDSRPANLENSTRLSRTSDPCSRGSIEFLTLDPIHNMHSPAILGEYLEIPCSKRSKGKCECHMQSPLHTPGLAPEVAPEVGDFFSNL